MSVSVIKFTLRASNVKAILTYSIIVLLALNLIGMVLKYSYGREYFYGFVPKFDFNDESNIPTYFSSLLLLAAACLLYVISAAIKMQRGAYAKHWFFLAIIFLFLSIDESAAIHELLVRPLRAAFHLSGVLHFSWVVVGICVVAATAIIYFRFLFALPGKIKAGFVLAAVVYLGGALGMEMLGGYYASHYRDYAGYDYVYAWMTTFEELLEMAGVVIFINALITFMRLNKLGIQCDISD